MSDRLTVANLLDLDPDLAGVLGPARSAEARRLLDVRVVRLGPGTWDPTRVALGPTPVGLLLTEGLVLRRVCLDHRTSAELLGGGDLLRPWLVAHPPFSADWRVLEGASLALLDRHAGQRLSRFPELLLALLEREALRARRLSERHASTQLGSTEDRLRVELQRLAERWGTVRPDGVALQLPLTHEVLGHLIGTRRPAVTSALSRMTRARELEPLTPAGWLLRGGPAVLLPTAA